LDIIDELRLGETNLPSMLNGTIRLLFASISSILSSILKEKDFRFCIDSLALTNISFTVKSSLGDVGTGMGVLVGVGDGVGCLIGSGVGDFKTRAASFVSVVDLGRVLSSGELLQAELICKHNNSDKSKNNLKYPQPVYFIADVGFIKRSIAFGMSRNYAALV
tara:strand:+ start:293 stop:781 length:489 start_codon:yes stop_codon:yes gene_type:complete